LGGKSRSRVEELLSTVGDVRFAIDTVNRQQTV
jgi:hypothetical protein